MDKINLAILTGGTSEEHEISLLSGYNIANSINLEKYNLYIIGIQKNGEWHLYRDLNYLNYLNNKQNPKNILLQEGEKVVLLPTKQKHLYSLIDNKTIATLDVVFSILHGKDGEDGSVQGLLNLWGYLMLDQKL